MAKERKGYVFEDKDGRVWARFTYTDEVTGKRKILREELKRELMLAGCSKS